MGLATGWFTIRGKKERTKAVSSFESCNQCELRPNNWYVEDRRWNKFTVLVYLFLISHLGLWFGGKPKR